MPEIELEPELDARLERLAQETGQTKSYYARQAIQEFLEDREDYLLGIASLERQGSSHEFGRSEETIWPER